IPLCAGTTTPNKSVHLRLVMYEFFSADIHRVEDAKQLFLPCNTIHETRIATGFCGFFVSMLFIPAAC
ncbi:MAG: hypothetical protein PHF75_08975, partial [Gallionella sp.]|nr:hypothetical protein [Gallionella sp.]